MYKIEYLTTSDTQIATYTWEPEGKPRSIILILHGQAEHAGRYTDFAQFLSSKGHLVKAHDHRGHGKTSPPEQHGHFADQKGWQRCIEDIQVHQQHIQQKHNQLPFILFGQGMGSFMTQEYMIQHSNKLAGAILSGTNGKPGFATHIVRFISHLERIRLGKNGRSAIVERIINGEFNKLFQPVNTPASWRCGDQESQQKFVEDPMCGFLCSPQLWLDLFDGIQKATSPRRQKNIQKEMPIFVIGGAQDPVGMQTGGVKKLLHQYRMLEMLNVTYTVFPNCRHETLHEQTKAEVYKAVSIFIDGIIKTP